jgi:hypothetical protein
MISQRLLQHNNSSVTIQKFVIKNTTRRKLTVNAVLRVTMAFLTTRISSLSLKRSSCQGVPFQSISHHVKVGPDDDDSGTYALDVPGSFRACSIWARSLNRSSFVPPGIALMGSTSMTGGEVDAPTSPIVPCAPASAPGGRVAILASAPGGGVAVLESAAGGGVAVLVSSTSVCTATPGQETSYEKATPGNPGPAEVPQPTYRDHHPIQLKNPATIVKYIECS